ncbi:hypothetical protein D3C73_1086420 [compost metagenome]
MAIPGKVATHQLVAKYCLPSLNIPPQETAGGFMPKPKKLREASIIIVVATLIVDMTIKEDMTLGRICVKIILTSLAPTALAAFTKSRSFTLSTSPRTTRA